MIYPMTLYSGPGLQFEIVGTLDAAETVRVLTFVDNFTQIECPPGALSGDCWLRFEPNDFFRYEAAAPIALTLPDPADLNFGSVTAGLLTPDGRWEIGVLRSETVYLIEGVEPPYFYTTMELTSTEDGTTWTPVAEWHAAGLGEEGPPIPFHWSEDGRYLYHAPNADPNPIT